MTRCIRCGAILRTEDEIFDYGLCEECSIDFDDEVRTNPRALYEYSKETEKDVPVKIPYFLWQKYGGDEEAITETLLDGLDEDEDCTEYIEEDVDSIIEEWNRSGSVFERF